MKVGNGLESCTATVQTCSFSLHDHTVTLIDTPGFDDTNLSDTEVLKRIALHLEVAYVSIVCLYPCHPELTHLIGTKLRKRFSLEYYFSIVYRTLALEEYHEKTLACSANFAGIKHSRMSPSSPLCGLR